MEPWISALADIAFPVVVAFYLLTSLKPALEKVERSIVDMALKITVGLEVILHELGAKERYEEQLAKSRGAQIQAETK